MCMTCVATGSAYLVPTVVGLRLTARRLRRRRLTEEASPPGPADARPSPTRA